VFVLWAVASGGCGDDDPAESDRAVWAYSWVAAFDREVAATCRCFVAGGQYASEEECMDTIGSSPTWASCAVRALEGTDASVQGADARCMIEKVAARATCLEAAACDPEAIDTCFSESMTCAPLDEELVLRVLEKCPDTALLGR